MIKTDTIIYVELQKSGSTFTREVIANSSDGVVRFPKHRPLYKIKNREAISKVIVGNIRNPFDWYVSFWAYGCLKKGSAYDRVRKLDWDYLYSDSMDVELFRLWVKKIFSMPGRAEIERPERKHQNITNVGLLTWRYFELYTRVIRDKYNCLGDIEAMREWDRNNNELDMLIRFENLVDDIREYAEWMGMDKKRVNIHLRKLSKQRDIVNRTKHLPFPEYYDEETRGLVAEMDKFIIEKYEYECA